MEDQTQSTTYEDWYKWHASIDPERESLLLHRDESRLVAGDVLTDMFGASELVQWSNLAERLRDLDSPKSLFDGHDALLQVYAGATTIRTIPAIALITVSLNNHVVRHNLPFKFCWTHVSLPISETAFFMAFGAWSDKEREEWSSMNPGFRAKRCSAWENTILSSSKAIRIHYQTDKSISHKQIPFIPRGTLQWAARIMANDEEWYDGGLFVGLRRGTTLIGQCRTSEQLYSVLSKLYQESPQHKTWKDLRSSVLNAIQMKRQSSTQHTNTFWRAVGKKVSGPETAPAMVKKTGVNEGVKSM